MFKKLLLSADKADIGRCAVLLGFFDDPDQSISLVIVVHEQVFVKSARAVTKIAFALKYDIVFLYR